MAHPSAFALLLSCLLVPASAISGPSTKEAEVNGVRLPYVEQGSGEPIVFIHGAISDLRAWEPIRDEIAKKYRFVAYTQRYFGIGAWKDDGKQFGVATHASDLAKLITALNTGPVHLVGWSYGGAVATEAALKNPSLVRSLILYEPAVWEVLSANSPEEKEALEDRSKIFGPAVAANNAGNAVQATRLLLEGVFYLPHGGFDREPEAAQTIWLDNSRTTPLLFAASPTAITCDTLKNFSRPTLVLGGEKSSATWRLINDAFSKCIPGARNVILHNVNHDAPLRDPAGFSAAVIEFLSKR
jgi:pimeloyl-ACP methyl ester carboxylesterase